ncbi:MAG: hypothetical protein ABF665_02335 [Gluconacetobacter sp.]
MIDTGSLWLRSEKMKTKAFVYAFALVAFYGGQSSARGASATIEQAVNATSGTMPASQAENKLRLAGLNGCRQVNVPLENGRTTVPLVPHGDSSATNLVSVVGLLSRRIVPDTLRVAADGDDDAPSVQRALNMLSSDGQLGGEIMFLPRIYKLNSPIMQTNQGVWRCVQGHMSTGGLAADPAQRYGGTWFQIGARFIGSSTPPITISSGTAIGATIDGCAFFEIQPASLNPAAGSVTAAWKPAAYPFVIGIQDVKGEVFITNTLWRGITKGVYSDNAGRLQVRNAMTDFYTTGFEVHHDYDVDRFVGIHEWGFNGSELDKLHYKTHNENLIRLYRADTPILDDIFAINTFSAIDLEQDSASGSLAGGVSTKVNIGTLICDGSVHCILNDAPATTVKVSILDAQGQDNTQKGLTAHAGSSAIEMAAYGTVQVGSLYTQSMAQGAIHLFGSQCSYVSVDSLVIDESGGAAGARGYVADMAACARSPVGGTNTVSIGKPPARIMAAPPSTYMPFTATGSLLWTVQTSHQ